VKFERRLTRAESSTWNFAIPALFLNRTDEAHIS
jgi:hypothetical protein